MKLIDLEGMKPPKFLRYFFYIAYSWYTPHPSERDTAQYSAAIFLAIPHGVLVFPIASILKFNDFNKIHTFLFFIFVFIIHYFLFIHKNKWREYIKEFSYLSKKDRKKGTIYLFIYLSIYLFIIVPISFWYMSTWSPYWK